MVIGNAKYGMSSNKVVKITNYIANTRGMGSRRRKKHMQKTKTFQCIYFSKINNIFFLSRLTPIRKIERLQYEELMSYSQQVSVNR